jgi:hypothetical protein
MSISKYRQPSTRSNQLRQKRQQPNAPKRQVAAKKPAPRSVAHVSPVVSRSVRYGTPLRQAAVSQPRRKVYYAVGANGVETRMPALPILQFNWQWISGFLTIGFLVLALLMTNLSAFEISSVNIKGLQRVTVEDLQPIIQNNSGSAFTFDKNKVKNSIAIAFPELTNINVSISLPNRINISAEERQPILAWLNGDQVHWIDAEGVVMSPRGDAGTLLTVESNGTLPLTNPEPETATIVDLAVKVIEQKAAPFTVEDSIKYFDPTVLKAAIEMSAIMPQGSVLVYDTVSGMGWTDPGGWKVYFGEDLENIQFKQAEYQAIIQQLANQGIVPAMVSVKHIDSPYYRTE